MYVTAATRRKRTFVKLSDKKLTSEKYARESDINVIMKKYEKTGIPSPSGNERFIDNSQIPDLMTAFEITQNAYNMFYELPAQVRKLMDNKPENLEMFIQNPQNHRFLEEHGLFVKNSKADDTSKGSVAAPASGKLEMEATADPIKTET